MNTGRHFIALVAILGFVISAGCSKPAEETQSKNSKSVTTDMEIVVPDSEPKTDQN